MATAKNATHTRIVSSRPKHSRRSRYIPALDGLRTFAVLAVIAYHMGMGWAPGGLMGVTVFFVISGYLINGLLVSEHDRTGTISLKNFWLRRVRRIIPAVLLAVAGTIVLSALTNPSLLDKARADILPSLLFYNNWWQIFHEVSYFEAASAPSPLTHYWSLAIEEQFYIVWPILLIVLFKCKLKKKPIAAIVLVLAALSAVEMAWMYNPATDPSRVYYGTDTRAVSLLIGVWLAFAWPSAAFGRPMKTQRNKLVWIVFNIAGVAAFAGIIVIVMLTSGFSPFPYRGGVVLTSVLAAVVIAVIVVPDTWLGRILQASPLVWIGKRSYGMYLWHYPIILATSRIGSAADIPWWVLLSQLIVIIAVSDLSYRFVENPIRSGALRTWWNNRKAGKRPEPGARVRLIVTVMVVGALFVGAIVSLVVVHPNSDGSRQQQVVASTIADIKMRVRQRARTEGLVVSEPTPSTSAPEAPEPETWIGETIDDIRAVLDENEVADQLVVHKVIALVRENLPDPSPVRRTIDYVVERGKEERARIEAEAYDNAFEKRHVNKKGNTIYDPLLIGDSVSAGCIDEFLRVFPHGCIDAVPNRNIWESPYSVYADAGQVGEYVVFCLGTNNAVEDPQIDELLAPIPDDKKIIMVNTREPRDWEASTNAAIERAPERHKNVVAVVDWYHESAGHDEYFYDDGIHLTNTGPQAYIGLIRDALEKAAIDEALANVHANKKANA